MKGMRIETVYDLWSKRRLRYAGLPGGSFRDMDVFPTDPQELVVRGLELDQRGNLKVHLKNHVSESDRYAQVMPITVRAGSERDRPLLEQLYARRDDLRGRTWGEFQKEKLRVREC